VKTLVEDCRSLDVRELVRAGALRPGLETRGRRAWRNRLGQEVASIGYRAAATSDAGTLRLAYRLGRPGGEQAFLYEVPLVTTALPSGGRRWWFLCPGRRGQGPACGRRVAVLYLPPRGRVFACRTCHGLAYRSSRESRKGDAASRRLASETGLPLRLVRVMTSLERLTARWAPLDEAVRETYGPGSTGEPDPERPGRLAGDSG
jgi:hypothetical protein